MKAMKPGLRLKSAVCSTEVMVIRGPGTEMDLRCGGVAMLGAGEAAEGAALNPQFGGGTLVGKRYIDAADSIELLCTKGGDGALSLGDTPLENKVAKALPSSD